MATSRTSYQIFVPSAENEVFYNGIDSQTFYYPTPRVYIQSGDAALDPVQLSVIVPNAARLTTTIADGTIRFIGSASVPAPALGDPNAINGADVTINDNYTDAVTALQTVRVTFTPYLLGTDNTAIFGGTTFQFEVGDVTSNGFLIFNSGGKQRGGDLTPPSAQTITLLAGHTYQILEFVDADVNSQQKAAGTLIGNQIDVVAGFTVSELDQFGQSVSGSPDLQFDSGLRYDVTPACYVRGTRIGTAGGETPVEELTVGDVVMTVSGVVRPIRWIGRRSYAGRFLAANPHIQPIRFQAGSLGGGLPLRDLLISPKHALWLDDMLIPAECLVNGSTIHRDFGRNRVDYFHIELDAHEVVLAEGAGSETFIDDGSRLQFHNAADAPPDARAEPAFYAPRIEGGPVLDRVRSRLESVAAVLKKRRAA